MNDQEKEKFIFTGNICKAAKSLGMGLMEDNGPGGYAFVFIDPMTSKLIYGEAAPERKDALFNAARALQSYFLVEKK